MLDSESSKRLIEQTGVSRSRGGDKFEPGNRDTVARYESEDDLSQREQLYRTIFDDLQDAIFITDGDLRFI